MAESIDQTIQNVASKKEEWASLPAAAKLDILMKVLLVRGKLVVLVWRSLGHL